MSRRGTSGSFRISVRVQPRASRDSVEVQSDGSIRIRLQAPPADGAANKALIGLMAGTLRVPRRAVRIVAGARGRTKILEFDAEARPALTALLDTNRPQQP
jgi:uncharacterized protein (TIGR00251 family)